MLEREPLWQEIKDAFQKKYKVGVVMPYGSDIKGDKAYLPFFSSLAAIAAKDLYKHGNLEKIALFGESTLGKGNPTTTELTEKMLKRFEIPDQNIIMPENGQTFNNTYLQIKALRDLKKRQGLSDNEILIVAWGFHKERVENYTKGFGINARVVEVEKILQAIYPNFNIYKFDNVLNEFDKKEELLRIISKLGKYDFITPLLTPLRSPRVVNVHAVRSGANYELVLFEDTGKEKVKKEKKKAA